VNKLKPALLAAFCVWLLAAASVFATTTLVFPNGAFDWGTWYNQMRFNGKSDVSMGSLTTPSYTFQGAESSGVWFDPSTNQVKITCVGVLCGTFGGGVSTLFPSGTAALPGAAFTADTSTGLYLPAVGLLGFSTGGVARWQIDASGNWVPQGASSTQNIGAAATLVNSIFDAILQVGATPALTGSLRVTNNQAAVWRNAGNTADITGLNVDASNVVQIGSGATSISLNVATTTGALTINGNTSAAGNLNPSADATDTLGTGALRWLSGAYSSFLQIGTNPASSGTLRIPNNTSIVARNAANTADQVMLGIDASNNLQVGSTGNATIVLSNAAINPQADATDALGTAALRYLSSVFSSFVAIGTNPAASGAIRLANNTAVSSRNGANSGDFTLLFLDASNDEAIGATGLASIILNNAAINPGADATDALGSSSFRYLSENLSSFLAIGTNPAISGDIRHANAATENWRNQANNGDVAGISVDASNNLVLGGATASAIVAAQTIFPSTDAAENLGKASTNRWKNILYSGHRLTQGGTAPTLSGCGTSPTLTAGSQDDAGSLTVGTIPTACTITFGAAYGTLASCVCTSNVTTQPCTITTATATAFTMTQSTQGPGNVYFWQCSGQS
jgi:hypothetical protein